VSASPSLAPTPTIPEAPIEQEACGAAAAHGVVLLVDPELRPGIYDRLMRFEADLCAAGYFVYERRSGFSTPPELRAYLTDLRTRTREKLEGAYFVGSFPFAYQFVTAHSLNPKFPDTNEEVVSLQYYEDLDGVFSRSPGYASRGGHEYSYDRHSGAIDWELWTSVLPRAKGPLTATVDGINRYLDRNHAFRTGQLLLPDSFLFISELNPATTQTVYDTTMESLAKGEYAWTPLSNRSDARIYIDSVKPPLSASEGYERLTEGVADVTVLQAHGSSESSGQIDTTWVKSHSVRTFLLWSDACATAYLERPDNFMTTVLYSAESSVLVAKGSSNNASGLGNNKNGFYGHNIATAIVSGGALGEAVVAHVNTPLLSAWSDYREFLFAPPVLLGDPTIRLRP
jgi:hypothetical protein